MCDGGGSHRARTDLFHTTVRRGTGAMGRLDGKVALISGGARGQGATEAQLFAREGAKVVLGDLLDEAGKQVEETIRQQGGEATYVHLDVTSEADWVEAVGTAVNRYGTLDILVNNAGISGASASGEPVHLEDATEAAWDRVLAVNAKGVFLGTKHAIPAMRQAGGGSIINISSIAGLVGGFGPSSGAYGASKGAVRLLTKSTATQYAKDGIRCNSVHPGFIDTPMTERSLSIPATREDRIRRTPLGRIGTPEEIAYGVLYLASDESSFVTGSELVIDGGYTAQ
jgi:NAD(P)-dependent dehydrogenase (short-subunit alcohol dehydrogenase family)